MRESLCFATPFPSYTLAISTLWFLAYVLKGSFFLPLCYAIQLYGQFWGLVFSIVFFSCSSFEKKEISKQQSQLHHLQLFLKGQGPLPQSVQKSTVLVFSFFHRLIYRSSSGKERTCLANKCSVALHLINIMSSCYTYSRAVIVYFSSWGIKISGFYLTAAPISITHIWIHCQTYQAQLTREVLSWHRWHHHSQGLHGRHLREVGNCEGCIPCQAA